MKGNSEKGASNLAGILILVFLFFIILSTPRSELGNFNFGPSAGGTDYSPSGSLSSYRPATGTGDLSIGSGNAPYAYQSYEEYITLDNRGRQPVNITGFQLKNGKDQRPYYTGSMLQRFSADVAVIPQGTLKLLSSGTSLMQDIVLADGERAIVTTGSVGNRSPYQIYSFKENMCSGYLEALPEYAFYPPLSQNCPRPYNEAGVRSMETTCRQFVETLSSCQTPRFGGKDERGENCPDCVNGKLLSSTCRAFVIEHFSYQGCLLYHSNDRGFLNRTWRIFLGRGWEMWAKDYESIELFDRFGQLVNFQNY